MSSDSAGPGSNGRIAAAVGMKQREGVGRARLAADRDEDAAASGQRFEDPAVMCLKADTPHGAGEADRRQIAEGSLQRGDERPVCHRSANHAQLQSIARSSERLFDEGRSVVGRLRENGRSVVRETRLLQRVERLRGPGDVLKHGDGEESGLCVDPCNPRGSRARCDATSSQRR